MVRLDTFLTENGFYPSRERAKRAITEGFVEVDGVVITKPSFTVSEDNVITTHGDPVPYVSRGGLKLEHALDFFNIDITRAHAVDIGASTGGFTQVLLQRGCSHVHCVDVGTNQLAESLRNDSRIDNFEGMDIRTFAELSYTEYFDFACVDVSFISLTKIFPHLSKLLKKDSNIVALIKPQYEVGRENIGKGGIVKNKSAREKAVEKVKEDALKYFRIGGITQSPITGGDGNVEYLIWLIAGGVGY